MPYKEWRSVVTFPWLFNAFFIVLGVIGLFFLDAYPGITGAACLGLFISLMFTLRELPKGVGQ